MDAGYPDRLGPSCKFVEDSTKLTCLQITGYRIKYSTVLWLIELQIRSGRQVQTQVHTVNSNSRTANCQCRLFSKKNPIIRNFYMSGRLAAPISSDTRRSAVLDTASLLNHLTIQQQTTSPYSDQTCATEHWNNGGSNCRAEYDPLLKQFISSPIRKIQQRSTAL